MSCLVSKVKTVALTTKSKKADGTIQSMRIISERNNTFHIIKMKQIIYLLGTLYDTTVKRIHVFEILIIL